MSTHVNLHLDRTGKPPASIVVHAHDGSAPFVTVNISEGADETSIFVKDATTLARLERAFRVAADHLAFGSKGSTTIPAPAVVEDESGGVNRYQSEYGPQS